MEFIDNNNIIINKNNNFGCFLDSIKDRTSLKEVMCLNLFIDNDHDDDLHLKSIYESAAEKHNNKILNDPHFYDAGFDIYLPQNSDTFDGSTRFLSNHRDSINFFTNKVDFKVKCCAKIYNLNKNYDRRVCSSDIYDSYFSPFYTYARSSLSKTPLRLANNQGIIDAGYRGNLIGMFDCIQQKDNIESGYDYVMEKYTRILQICAPSLIPIYVNVVDSINDLGPSTSRGDGGFGSTGV